MLEHCRSTREHDVLRESSLIRGIKEKTTENARTDLVQAATNVDGRSLNGTIDDLREWGQKVGRVYFWIEEDFRCEEALVPNVDRVVLSMEVSRWWGIL
jgi:hypothetical protein